MSALETLFHFPTAFCAYSPIWKQARSTWNFNTVCRTVSIRTRDFSFWPKIKRTQPFRYYRPTPPAMPSVGLHSAGTCS